MVNALAIPEDFQLRITSDVQPWEYWRLGQGAAPMTHPKPPIADGMPTESTVTTPTPTLTAARLIAADTPVPSQSGVTTPPPVTATAGLDSSPVLFRVGTVAVTRNLAVGIGAAVLLFLALRRRR